MKKFIFLLVGIFSLLLVTNVKAVDLPEVTDHEKVTIYVFRGHGCSHCYDALTFLFENASSYSDYFEVKAYEVWNNQKNRNLMSAVSEAFEDNVNGVPYIIVGNSYHKAGFGSQTGTEIINTALSEYQNSKYTDVVKKTIKNNKLSVSVETLEEACAEEGITEATITNKEETTGGKYDILIISGILVVIFGGVVALILTNRHD